MNYAKTPQTGSLNLERRLDTQQPDVTVITISTNEGDVLDRCMAAIFASDASFEYIVFDNASNDDTSMLLKEKYNDPRLRTVVNSTKKGFIENNNKGISLAKGRYILLLNPDTMVYTTTLSQMVRFMDSHPSTAVSTCKLIYADGSAQLHVRRFPTPWVYFCRILKLQRWIPNLKSIKRYLMLDFDRDLTQEVDWFITAFFSCADRPLIELAT